MVAVVLTLFVGRNFPWSNTLFPWLVGAACLGVLVVNIRWRSMRVNLIYTLCLACRARRGHWIMIWFVAFLVAIALSYFVYPLLILALVPMYAIAERWQPAVIRPAKVTKKQIWLRGVGPQVRDRFPQLEGDD